jgi:lysophospholipase L1-like esterase
MISSIVIGLILLAAIVSFLFIADDREEQNHEPEAHPQRVTYRITALGDSLTEGVGDEQGRGYAGITAETLKKRKDTREVTVANFSHRGDTSENLRNVLKRPDVRNSIGRSTTVFVTIGGNDLAGVFRQHFLNLKVSDFQERQKIYEGNLKAILDEIRAINSHADVFVIGLYNPFEDYLGQANTDFKPILDDWNEAIERIVRSYEHTRFVPTADLFEGKANRLLYEDHFHPNEEGYALIANRLVRFIDETHTSNR